MFLTLKRKWIILFFCSVFVATSIVIYFAAVKPTFVPKPEHIIVIDAGHGGMDNGASGKKTGVLESQLNLSYAKALMRICEQYNFKVIMTRSTSQALYSVAAANKKRDDMQKRKQIIDNSGADIVVSIHMNSFPLSSSHGAQVFYAKGNVSGEKLAQSVQSSIQTNFVTRGSASVGDFYILNCTDKPAILIEFGFLSNPEEELLLQDNNYMNEICFYVFGGILSFFK